MTMNKSQKILFEQLRKQKAEGAQENPLIIEEELVGELSFEDAEELFGKNLYIEFNHCSDGIEGQLEDLYESEVMRIVIKMKDGEYEDRELHEVSHYEVRG